MKQLTVRDLMARLAACPMDALLYVYVGGDGARIQAEWPTPQLPDGQLDLGAPTSAVVLDSPDTVPSAGGPAQ